MDHKMELNTNTQAIILMTIPFEGMKSQITKPLSLGEWGRLDSWLCKYKLEPSALITENVDEILSDWSDKTINADRVRSLLSRGGALGLVAEKWSRSGLWTLIQSDTDYPERLKQKLEKKAPPILFGFGNKKILNKGGITIVGARNVNDEDLFLTENLSIAASSQGYTIISGGAKGVDETAMIMTLENEGMAIGVLADSLLQKSRGSKFRNFLMTNDLVLISPFNPDAGFSIGNAMARNRYIYCLADMAIAIGSKIDKGGTWSGAVENLRAKWVPLWVVKTNDSDSGNTKLVEKGANWLPKSYSISPKSCIFKDLINREQHEITKEKKNTTQSSQTSLDF